MPTRKSSAILNRPVEELNASESFKSDFSMAGFETLKAALEYDADVLIKEYGFSYHTITELITLLNQEGLGRLLKD